MKFSPAFEALLKFTEGLPKVPISESEVLAVSRYLGVELSDASLEDRVIFLSKELSSQNAFLSFKLSLESIYDSDEYRKSAFVREIVTNNRMNLKNNDNYSG